MLSHQLGRQGAMLRASVVAAVMLITRAGVLSAQPPPQPELPQPAPAIPQEGQQSSQVFPEGGFPQFPSKPEGGIPAPAPKPGDGPLYPLLASPVSAYRQPGYYNRDFDVQDSPAAEYEPYSAPLPGYYYRPGYAFTAGFATQLRSVLEYAPPGYEARDQQWGPGTREFMPIPSPAPVTPEERERFVVRGLMPGSFLVPGTNTSFRFRGFVRLMGLYDFNPIGSTDSFVPNTIPVPQSSGQNFNMSARYSRIAIESWTPTAFREWNVHTFVEGDFFNGPAQAAGGGGNPFRLRHAFVDFGYFRVGQQNTVFMDASTWPSVVDFQGPAGWVNQRQPSARMTIPLADKLFWATSMERPFSDITTNGQGVAVQDVPDFATHLRYEADRGHLQVSGLFRTIGYQPTGGDVTRRGGLGMSAASTLHPWALLTGSVPLHKDNPTALDRCRLIGQYTFGWGTGRYVQDTVGQGLDAQVDPATGSFDTLYIANWMISYEHWYTEKWLSAITYSAVNVGNNGNQPGNTYVGGKYFTTNLWYIPIPNLSLGLEYVWGERENLDGQQGRANRVNGLVQYNF